MRFGVTLFLTDRTIDPTEFAVEAEHRGFSSVWFPEHTHIPVSRDTPPPTGDDELADEYRRTLDPYIALAGCAAVTSRIRLGTGVGLVAQHDPVVLAKQIATLDVMSKGRVSLGVGFGWNREEMQTHGIHYGDRRAIAREHVLAMQQLWANDVARFDGTHTQVPPSWQWPKPSQHVDGANGVPIFLGGGAGPILFSHVAEYGHGWMPIGGAGLGTAIPSLRERVAEVGRDPLAIEIVPFGVMADASKLDRYQSLGVTESVLRVKAGLRDVVLNDLDRLAGIVERL